MMLDGRNNQHLSFAEHTDMCTLRPQLSSAFNAVWLNGTIPKIDVKWAQNETYIELKKNKVALKKRKN